MLLLHKSVIIVSLLSFLIDVKQCAKILGLTVSDSQSHFQLGNMLMKTLAQRGHEVTLFSSFLGHSSNLPENYTLVQVLSKSQNKNYFNEEMANSPPIEKANIIQKYYIKKSAEFLKHREMRKLIESNSTFDLVILDLLFTEPLLGLAHHFGAHSIVVSAYGSSSLTNRITRNEAPISYVPNMIPAAGAKLTFMQRLHNLLGNAGVELGILFPLKGYEPYLRKWFPNAPSLRTLLDNVSLILINSHFTIDSPRPYVPNMISIGGAHIPEPKELVGELKEFADNATDGFLYCSFGSLIRTARLDRIKVDLILSSFAALAPRLKVLWIFEEDIAPSRLPPNVVVSKWVPQMDVLAHPNAKLFISHSGMMSTLEAIYNGVPVIGVPFFGDQNCNIKHLVEKKVAIELDFDTLTKESLVRAILEILDNPQIYSANAERYSRLFRDQPMKPLDKAMYWIEYVLKHNGAHHMKVQALKLSWYEYYMIDVMVALCAFAATVLFVIKKVSYLLFQILVTNFDKRKKEKKL